MKIIEALKQIKDLKRKAEDIKDKVSKHSALLSYETSPYPDQKQQVKEWVQSYSDILKEILRLTTAIQKTNLATKVAIQIGDNNITKSIAEWIVRRRDLSKFECGIWKALTDRNLKEGKIQQSTGEVLDVKIVRCYDAQIRDKKIFELESEPQIIDGKLEIVNAITDLIE